MTDHPIVMGVPTAADRDSILNLLEDAPFKSTIWSWQFERVDALQHCVVARSGGELLGFNGAMPVQVWDGARQTSGLWSCDFVVRFDHRRLGLGRQIKRVLDSRSTLLMTLGVSEGAARVLLKSGWAECPGPVELVKDVLGIAGDDFPEGVETTIDGYLVRLEEGLPDDAALLELWNRLAANDVNAVVRDPVYLRWRYLENPSTTYRFLTVRSGRQCVAVSIWRLHEGVLRWVDYLGPLGDSRIFSSAAASVAALFPGARRLHCRTTWEPLQSVLLTSGWRVSGKPLRFFVKSAEPSYRRHAWFIMSGDADGEFLEAARQAQATLTTRQWTEQEFLAAEELWADLLARSNADQLFMSWDWQTLWWKHFGKPNGLALRVIAAYDEQGELAGIAPLTVRTTTVRGVLPTRRLQPFGQIWCGPDTMKTEYCGFLLRSDLEQVAAYALASAVADSRDWHEFAVQNAPAASATLNAIFAKIGRHCLRRDVTEPEGSRAWVIEVSGSFEEHLRRVGGHYGAHSLRQRINTYEVSHRFPNEASVDEVLNTLNDLHFRRWGKPAFDGAGLRFHREFGLRKAERGELLVEFLSVNGEPKSVLYNFIAGDRQYNIQSGFDPQSLQRHRVSLGLLHLGHSVERAHRDPDIRYYDFLAGPGKNRYFKRKMSDFSVQFVDLNFIRPPIRQLAYRLGDVAISLIRGTLLSRLVGRRRRR